jgi:NAD(P)-dependent dehydrogenase (short-subunit alcohol dehydrogenase family)
MALGTNAGIRETQRCVETMSAARLERLCATHVIGAFLCAREAMRRLFTRPGGMLVTVGSSAARIGIPGESVDSAVAKGAMDTMTRVLAAEGAEDGL